MKGEKYVNSTGIPNYLVDSQLWSSVAANRDPPHCLQESSGKLDL